MYSCQYHVTFRPKTENHYLNARNYETQRIYLRKTKKFDYEVLDMEKSHFM